MLRYKMVSAMKCLPAPPSTGHTDLRSGAGGPGVPSPRHSGTPHLPAPMRLGPSPSRPSFPTTACTPTPHAPARVTVHSAARTSGSEELGLRGELCFPQDVASAAGFDG